LKYVWSSSLPKCQDSWWWNLAGVESMITGFFQGGNRKF
jgi:hypothetical protein